MWLPAAGQDLQILSADYTENVTAAEIDSAIEAAESREDLDEEARTKTLDYLRDAQTQIQIKLDADAAAQQYAASLKTAPVELEELRAALDEYPPESPTAENLGIHEGTTLEELQQWLAREIAALTDIDLQLADLKELVEIQGKSDTVGRPLIYGTSKNFMEYFGINDLKDLPTPKDFAQEENKIGEESDD